MKKASIYFAVFWSAYALWNTYRVFSNIPRLIEQARWITVGDMLWLSGSFALAIYYWVVFVKESKKKDEQGKDENG